LSLWSDLAGWILGLQVVLYALPLLSIGIVMALRSRTGLMVIAVPLAIGTMHISWGGAFLWSMASLLAKRMPPN